VKRLFDLVSSGLGLIILAPLLLILACLILWRMGRPVLFRQRRAGLHGVPFQMYKFRTMRGAHSGSDAERLTRLGNWLRSTSLDELPELWNVLRGDMSLVGPRPLLVEYLPRYSSRQARRHQVKPGITGWAQVNGRNLLPWDERLEMDVWYVSNRSIGLDVKILAMTLLKVVRREGISSDRSATMELFQGNRPGQ
jgi:lipopolysaccharide/colanic/teichoic acid biosynthesis glycosyltransferase